jgi:hypothetical protein
LIKQVYITNRAISNPNRKYKIKGLANTDGYTIGGIRCLGGVSIPKNTDPWIYQRCDQVSRRSKLPYKHGPLDIPEVGSGV